MTATGQSQAIEGLVSITASDVVATYFLPPIPMLTWLTTHSELHTSRRIRVVFDFLADALSGFQPGA